VLGGHPSELVRTSGGLALRPHSVRTSGPEIKRGSVMRALWFAGPAVPPAALSVANVPWFAWMVVALASLGVMAWRIYLAHIAHLERLKVQAKQIEVENAVKLKALENIDKVRGSAASQLMAAIAGTPEARSVEQRPWPDSDPNSRVVR
jgi:hypothetical protein